MAQSAAPLPSQCSIPIPDPDLIWPGILCSLHTGWTGVPEYENLGSQRNLALSDVDCVALITADDSRPCSFHLFEKLLAINGLPFRRADFDGAWGKVMAVLNGFAQVVFAWCRMAGLQDGAMPLALAQYVGTFLLPERLEKCLRLVVWSCKGYDLFSVSAISVFVI